MFDYIEILKDYSPILLLIAFLTLIVFAAYLEIQGWNMIVKIIKRLKNVNKK